MEEKYLGGEERADAAPGSLDVKTETGQDSPDWRTGQDSPDWRTGQDGPDWRTEQDGPDWRTEQDSPDWQTGQDGSGRRTEQAGSRYREVPENFPQYVSAGDPGEEAEEAQKKQDRKAARRSAILEELLSWVKSFVIMFCVALFLTEFIIINAVIPSGSMEDTIMTHDRLIGARFSYWFSEPQRGDIVIFHYPVDEKKIYIKRVIGLPGETVRIEDGKIYINDSSEPLQEGYLKESWDVLNTGFEFHVPEDSYLMLGDNRNWSEDARYWADNALDEGLTDTEEEAQEYSYVHKKKILGKAIFTYFRQFRILVHGGWYEEKP